MRCALQIVSADGKSVDVTLGAGDHILIGRSESAELQLVNDPSVSRLHCEVVGVPGSFRLRDLQSSNGTFLRGSRIDECSLHDQDVVLVGRTRIYVHIGDHVTEHLSPHVQPAVDPALVETLMNDPVPPVAPSFQGAGRSGH